MLERQDGHQALLLEHGLEALPELECQHGVGLGVDAHVAGWQHPHLGLWVDAPLGRSLLQDFLVLPHSEVVLAQEVEAVGHAVLVQERGGQHGVNDWALNINTLGHEPARIVAGVVHDLRHVGRGELLGQPAHRRLLVEVRPFCMGDGEVAGEVPGRDGDADDLAVLGCPARPHLRQLRVPRLEVDGHQRVSRQVRELGGHEPLDVRVGQVHLQQEVVRADVEAILGHCAHSPAMAA